MHIICPPGLFVKKIFAFLIQVQGLFTKLRGHDPAIVAAPADLWYNQAER